MMYFIKCLDVSRLVLVSFAEISMTRDSIARLVLRVHVIRDMHSARKNIRGPDTSQRKLWTLDSSLNKTKR